MTQSLLLWTQSYPQPHQLGYPFCKSQAWLVQVTLYLPYILSSRILTPAGNVERRIIQPTGVAKGSLAKTKGKDHGTRFCTVAPSPEYQCTFCRKGKHSTGNCRAKKNAEKEARLGGLLVTANDVSNTPHPTTGQHQAHPASAHSSGMLQMQTGLPDTLVLSLPIGQRLKN